MKRIFALFLTVFLLISSVMLCISAYGAASLRYTALGDSIPRGYAPSGYSVTSYTHLFANAIGAELDNRAVDGYTSANLLGDLQNSSSVRSSVSGANVITISIGGNDIINYYDEILALAVTSYLYGETYYSDAINAIYTSLKSNLLTIINTVYSLNPDALILFEDLYNPYYDIIYEGFFITAPVGQLLDPYIQRVNSVYDEVFSEISPSVKLYKVGVAAPMRSTPGCFYAELDFHPTQTGHNVISDCMISAFRSYYTAPVISTTATTVTTEATTTEATTATPATTTEATTATTSTTAPEMTTAEITTEAVTTETTTVETTATVESTTAEVTTEATTAAETTTTAEITTEATTTAATTTVAETTEAATTAAVTTEATTAESTTEMSTSEATTAAETSDTSSTDVPGEKNVSSAVLYAALGVLALGGISYLVISHRRKK